MRGDDAIATLANWLQESRQAVAFTGAGISTESGIDDFRSPGGLWTRHQPVMFDDFVRDSEERKRFWRQRREMMPTLLAAKPNAGHAALATLESAGRLHGIITQNIDELHQRAGSRNVLELHGTAMKAHCLSCDKRWSCEEIQRRLDSGEEELICDACDGYLKSMTISFGQAMPAAVMIEASQWARDCDLFLAIGSSLVVYPAAGFPEAAKRCGAKLVIVNREPTPLDEMADLVIRAPIGEAMGQALRQIKPLRE